VPVVSQEGILASWTAVIYGTNMTSIMLVPYNYNCRIHPTLFWISTAYSYLIYFIVSCRILAIKYLRFRQLSWGAYMSTNLTKYYLCWSTRPTISIYPVYIQLIWYPRLPSSHLVANNEWALLCLWLSAILNVYSCLEGACHQFTCKPNLRYLLKITRL